MISVEEARHLIDKNTPRTVVQQVNLYDAGGLVLAEDMVSATDVPPFHQSAMDGYAFKFSDWQPSKKLSLFGEIPAGHSPLNSYPKGAAVKIFTGAPVPEDFDTVVMQEKTSLIGNQLSIQDTEVKQGLNIRLKGSQTQKGELACITGTLITPAVAGYLASLGLNTVPVFCPPKICIINTGRELTPPGEELLPGKIYESNSYSLNAALKAMNLSPLSISTCDDNEELLTNLIKQQIDTCSILILSGGVSVGEYDFVAKALANCQVETIFHKVKQKPGKPLYFGRKNTTLVFGLPGNPAAVLTCFYQYIAPTLLMLKGLEKNKNSFLLPLASSYTKKSGLTHFLKAKLSHKEVLPLLGQESYLMNSFANADCIIQLDEEKTVFQKGDLVEVFLLTDVFLNTSLFNE